MPEVTDSRQAASAHKHVRIRNEQVHIDELGDFDCKQVSIDQCSLVNDYKHPIAGISIGLTSLLLGGYMFWQFDIHTANPSQHTAWAPLFLIAAGIYLLYRALHQRKHYLLKLHTETQGDVDCETSIDEMDELKHRVKLKCNC
ncbi:MAG TPA: hypothetical protein DCM28_19145 [Phycisphaerales bacterium]|nr:hypothetical protein [Phycisphaerales bacterium]HCD32567.1 hypothetical protein [Phycisphaerales bacterium]|tara:strand:- start:210 stop:638 length:429 start_codon:yes stop_codon:yes gene_type:complete